MNKFKAQNTFDAEETLNKKFCLVELDNYMRKASKGIKRRWYVNAAAAAAAVYCHILFHSSSSTSRLQRLRSL